MKAKDLSLVSKIIAVLICVSAHVLMWMGKLPNASSYEICVCSFCVMGFFGTVDINLVIDKFTKRQ